MNRDWKLEAVASADRDADCCNFEREPELVLLNLVFPEGVSFTAGGTLPAFAGNAMLPQIGEAKNLSSIVFSSRFPFCALAFVGSLTTIGLL